MWPYHLNHALILHTLNTMSLLSKQHNKIIVKVGSAVLTDDQGRVKKKILSNIARDIAALKNRKIVLVSSGAIAIGKRLLNIEKINSCHSNF